MSWIALIVGLIVIAAFVPTIIGVFKPVLLAKGVIRERLKALSIDPSTFSEACLSELSESTVRTAKILARVNPEPWRSFLRKNAELTAWTVYAIVIGEKDYTAKDIKAKAVEGTAPVEWQILAKHDPKRFGLDSLEMLQSTNQILRGVP
ncbi:MAG: hypothetical protein WCE79_28110 [Xanthobacteraceae bacterium]